ncbi:MAG: hypothetical protein KJP13_05010, partial [Altererythrobacter sp.]|nr:hypothetical protein [Altererythrobacter sp.]
IFALVQTKLLIYMGRSTYLPEIINVQPTVLIPPLGLAGSGIGTDCPEPGLISGSCAGAPEC